MSNLHILFVCTGNICRSPTAERLATAYGARMGISTLKTSSAGTRAVIGSPIHRDASSVLVGLGGDPSNFAARQFTPRVAAEADLILTMTKTHRDRVLEIAPRLLRSTFTLAEASRLVSQFETHSVADLARFRSQLAGDEIPDVPDPIGQGSEVFAAVGSQIAGLLPPVLELGRRASDHSAE